MSTTVVSVSSTGEEAIDHSLAFSMSMLGNGRRVAFESEAPQSRVGGHLQLVVGLISLTDRRVVRRKAAVD